jgi:tagaturonate reductase
MNLRRALDRSVITSSAPKASPVELPPASLLELPERAVQFGTGGFLRGFVEFFIDSANRAGSFDGRIVAIGSTDSGRDDVVNDQQGLYTLVTEGIENGRSVREFRLISSLSRALSANAEWDEVLQLARNPEIALVFSNTTEVGIVLDPDDELADPPRSFPGKLTAFLYDVRSSGDSMRARRAKRGPAESHRRRAWRQMESWRRLPQVARCKRRILQYTCRSNRSR